MKKYFILCLVFALSFSVPVLAQTSYYHNLSTNQLILIFFQVLQELQIRLHFQVTPPSTGGGSVPPPMASITVLAPTAGASWQSGPGQTVQWASANLPSSTNLTISLFRPDNSLYANLFVGTPNDGIQSIDLTGVPAGTYWIRLGTSLSAVPVYGGSGLFQIVAPTSGSNSNNNPNPPPAAPVISVLQPISSSTWLAGSSGHTISWTSAGIPAGALLTIKLKNDAGTDYGYPVIAVPNNGVYEIPSTHVQSLLPSTLPAGQYRYEISASLADGLSVVGRSAPFFVTVAPTPGAPPSISILSPTGGLSWTATTGQIVQWTSSNLPASNGVTLELLRPDNSVYSTLANSLNDGYQSVDLTGVPAGYYWVRLQTTVNGQTVYGGSSVFQITAPTGGNTTPPPPNTTPSITVTSPPTGAVWHANTSQAVQWSSVNVPTANNVVISLYLPNNTCSTGPTGCTLAASTPNDGHQSVDLTGVPAGTYWIRIRTTVNGTLVAGQTGLFQVAS